MRFVQPVRPLPDPYRADGLLRAHLDRLLGEAGHKAAAPALTALAADAVGPLRTAALDAEAHPPVHRPFDGWGARVDEIETSAGWEVQRRAVATHGIVALPYEETARQTWGAGARVVQHALLHLYSPDSAIFSCPVAMTDGAVTVLRGPGVDPALVERTVPRLLSRDPDVAWTSGQWMTETEGGSDVGRATTRARREGEDWDLHGDKWFCSATTAEMSVALARPDGAPEGSRGLACFVVPRYAEDALGRPVPRSPRGLRPTAPGLQVHRLKDKLGTHALPSAEVRLDGAVAWPVGDPCAPGGLRRMMSLVTVTRLHNSANAASFLRRGLVMARTYAETRVAFGTPLWRQPLHREVLSGLAVEADAAFALTGLCFQTLGRVEIDGDPESAALLRIASSLVKSQTARQAVAGLSEVMECFGGSGYIEDTGVPVLLRNALVLPVWEGTTTIQALDILRALLDPRVDTAGALLRRVDVAVAQAEGLGSDPEGYLARTARDVAAARGRAAGAIQGAVANPAASSTQAKARALAADLAALLTAAALLEQAAFDAGRGNLRTALSASLWVRRRLLGDPAHGEGDLAFAQLVDGEPL